MRFSKRQKILTTLVVAGAVVVGLNYNFTGSLKQLEPQKKITQVDNTAKKEDKKSLVTRQLYLIDQHGWVVPTAVKLPANNSAIKQTLEYLVQQGPVENILPDGFRATLPADTELSVDLKNDGTLFVNFSKDFKGYNKVDEERIMESIAWTATQFDTVKNVRIKINGVEQTEMPVAKTPMMNGLDRSIGINMQKNEVVDLMNTKAVTLYYISQIGQHTYYVPVTKRISNNEKDVAKAVVNELIQGPSYDTNLLSDFNSDVALLEQPKYENGKLTLNFNENLIVDSKKKQISDLALNEIVLSLTEQPGIESVAILVNGKANIANQEGKAITAPVNRPQVINPSSY